MIEFHDVAVCYNPGNRYPANALEDINFQLEDGEWVFLVGPSGAGKSTLLKLVYCGAQATSGQIIVDGRDITRLARRDIPFLRRKIGVVFQDFQLLTQKTVWENVAFALQVIGAPQKRLVRDVPRALETVGLTHKATALPHELSGGEQQRVAIARAIVNDPRILLADEPTGNLDPQTAADIAQVLRRINERGTTILMATHDRAVVDALRQRVVRLADGRVVSDEAAGVYHAEDDQAVQPPIAVPALVNGASHVSSNGASNGTSSNGGSVNGTHDSPSTAPATLPVPAVRQPAPPAPRAGTPVAVKAPEDEPSAEPYLRKLRRNEAPIGSPENPIVQYDSAPK